MSGIRSWFQITVSFILHFLSFWNFLTTQLYHISLFQWNGDFFHLLLHIVNNISVKFLCFCVILSKEGYLWMIIGYEWQKL